MLFHFCSKYAVNKTMEIRKSLAFQGYIRIYFKTSEADETMVEMFGLMHSPLFGDHLIPLVLHSGGRVMIWDSFSDHRTWEP